MSTGELIAELLRDPVAFLAAGRGYELLQHYFDGYPIETLRPLLRHESPLVQQVGSFVASELGAEAAPLLVDAVPLLKSSNLHVQRYAIDVVQVCAAGDQVEHYASLSVVLDSGEEMVKAAVADLLRRALPEQRAVLRRRFETLGRGEDAKRWCGSE